MVPPPAAGLSRVRPPLRAPGPPSRRFGGRSPLGTPTAATEKAEQLIAAPQKSIVDGCPAGGWCVARPATAEGTVGHRATKLRETQRTESTSKRLSKPHELQQTTMRRYRTQEVAGSSPASSINEVPAIHSLSSRSSVTSSRVSSLARSNDDETPPIPLTTSAQYQEAAEVAMRERPGLRKGRRFFNVLREMEPGLADRLTGTTDDPFSNDAKSAKFLARLAQQLQ
jgi:hypothetical protein